MVGISSSTPIWLISSVFSTGPTGPPNFGLILSKIVLNIIILLFVTLLQALQVPNSICCKIGFFCTFSAEPLGPLLVKVPLCDYVGDVRDFAFPEVLFTKSMFLCVKLCFLFVFMLLTIFPVPICSMQATTLEFQCFAYSRFNPAALDMYKECASCV